MGHGAGLLPGNRWRVSEGCQVQEYVRKLPPGNNIWEILGQVRRTRDFPNVDCAGAAGKWLSLEQRLREKEGRRKRSGICRIWDQVLG